MQEGGLLIGTVDAVAREATLFAALCFVLGGIDDLLVDLLYALRRMRRQLRWRSAAPPLDGPVPPGRIAVFVPAWDESAVIGRMLRTALARFDHPDYRLYVGAYPNDPATIAAVAEVAAAFPRVRLVIGHAPGPTTKADCLNALWRAMLRDEVAEGPMRAVVLHDAEDVVHPLELRVFAQWLERYEAVQLPVLPLRFPGSPLISGHYLDEFSEAHGKLLLVRQALGAGLPLAGVGCGIRREVLAEIAQARGGMPFDATSLTEDYELGLTIAARGGRVRLARVAERPGGPPVAVRAYFPARFRAAVRQKARWMTGIALAGWDRTGWARAAALGDHWMRMRDRRTALAMPVLAIAYASLLLWGVSLLGHVVLAVPSEPLPPLLQGLLWANFALLGWRLAVRAAFVGQAYGWREAMWSVPRVVVGNWIALFAARRAITLYLGLLADGVPKWDKTAHAFPEDPEEALA